MNPVARGRNTSERGAESEVDHKGAGWLHNPFHLGGHGGGKNQNWPTKGLGGYKNPSTWGVPNASQWGKESEVAHKWAGWLHVPFHPGGPQLFRAGKIIISGHKWAGWLHNPYCPGGPQHLRAGERIKSGPQVSGVAT